MFKRITLLLTISSGVFTKTRSFNSEHLYSVPHINFSGFDEVIIVCTDKVITKEYRNFIDQIVESLTVPLVISGGVSSLNDAKLFFNQGADRIIINRSLWDNPLIIREIAEIYGKQAIVASLDFCQNDNKLYSFDWENKLKRKLLLPRNFDEISPYIGEIFIQDVDQDGRVVGANIDLIHLLSKKLPSQIPIHIGSCGIVDWSQYSELLNLDFINAVSVSNIHHMSQKAIASLREYCRMNNVNIRKL